MKRVLATALVLLLGASPVAPRPPATAGRQVMRELVRLLGCWDAPPTPFALDVGHGVVLEGQLAVTHMGNGTLELGGLMVHALDVHDDGVVYEDEVLDVSFVDMDGDGYLDLVVSGTAIVTDDDADQSWLAMSRRVPVFGFYRFDPRTRRFQTVAEDSPGWLSSR